MASKLWSSIFSGGRKVARRALAAIGESLVEAFADPSFLLSSGIVLDSHSARELAERVAGRGRALSSASHGPMYTMLDMSPAGERGE